MPLPEDFENGVQGMLDYETARTKSEGHGAPPPKLADFLKDGAQDMLDADQDMVDADQDDPLRPLPPSKSLTVRGPGPAKITARTMLQAIERDREKVTEAAATLRRRLATLKSVETKEPGKRTPMDKIETLIILLRRDDRLDEQMVRASIQQLDGVRLVDAERFAISDAFVFASRRWGSRRVKLLGQMYKNIEKRSPESLQIPRTRRRRRRSKA